MSRKYRETNMRCLPKLLSTYANLLSNEAILQRCLFWLLLNPEQAVIYCAFYAASSATLPLVALDVAQSCEHEGRFGMEEKHETTGGV